MIITALKAESSAGKSGRGEQFRIELSDGSLFSFKNCYLPPEIFNDYLVNLKEAEGREINTEEEEAFRFASSCLRTEKAALRLIARAEQNTQGLTRKLEQRGCGRTCVNTVIERLTDLKLLDNRRYAQLWFESRLRLARSPKRLLYALCGRGIDRDDAEAALKAALDKDTEHAMITRFVKKHSRKKGGEGENHARSLRHLLKSEGFSLSAIEGFFDAG